MHSPKRDRRVVQGDRSGRLAFNPEWELWLTVGIPWVRLDCCRQSGWASRVGIGEIIMA